MSALADPARRADARARRHPVGEPARGGDRARVRSLVPALVRARVRAPTTRSSLRDRGAGRPLVVLAGHYDTVPAQENFPGRIEDGAVVGLGASDMKGGARRDARARARRWRRTPSRASTSRSSSSAGGAAGRGQPAAGPLRRGAARRRGRARDLLEPTDNTIQAGCLGNLNARLVFQGVSGHSARPWTAENAIEKALEGLRAVRVDRAAAGRDRRALVPRGASVTQIQGGIATNVIPARVEATSTSATRPTARRRAPRRHLRSSCPRARRSSSPATRRRPVSSPTRRSCSTCARRATSRSSRSRRGRTWPSSPPAGSTPSTSGPARRATRTPRRAGRDRRARADVHDALPLRHG